FEIGLEITACKNIFLDLWPFLSTKNGLVKMESRARILAIKRQKKRQLCATASDSFSLKNVNHKTHFLT
ncbi:hypothetical protein, partial [Vibrio parahaemolyticus]|uniref:hypothetical protein n=1 Tax=Vibrio parahaemolyticus TaxID=670 RepID=UPI001BB09BC2